MVFIDIILVINYINYFRVKWERKIYVLKLGFIFVGKYYYEKYILILVLVV